MPKGVVVRDSTTVKTSHCSRPLPPSLPNETCSAKNNRDNGKSGNLHLPKKKSFVAPLNIKGTTELSTITAIPKGDVAIAEPEARTEKGKGTRGGKRSSLTKDIKVVPGRTIRHGTGFAVFFEYALFMLKLNALSGKPHQQSYLLNTLWYWAENSYTLPKDEIVFRIKSLIYDNIKIMNEMDDQPDTRTDEEIRIDALEKECFAEHPYDI